MKHVLLPVPAMLLPKAAETFARENRVAFGSNAFDLWRKLDGQEATLWIAASASDGAVPVPGFRFGQVAFRGRFAGVVDADRRGRHPNPALQPDSGVTGAHHGQFVEVTELEPLTRAAAGLTTLQGIALRKLPQGPLMIRDPDPAP